MAAPRKTAKTMTDKDTLDAVGIDVICERIESGEAQAHIANSLKVSKSKLSEWLSADPERSARARESRIMSARHWDDQAEQVLLGADETVNGSIAKARELAQHYRWRASKYAPRDYGDKLQLDADVTVSTLTPEERVARIAALSAKLGIINK